MASPTRRLHSEISRQALAWLLVGAVLFAIFIPAAGLAIAALIAIVTATRPDLRLDFVWADLVASVVSVLTVVTVLSVGETLN